MNQNALLTARIIWCAGMGLLALAALMWSLIRDGSDLDTRTGTMFLLAAIACFIAAASLVYLSQW